MFFRFIKQELNFSHFVSTSANGIKNVLYITLILSMLILVYKKANEIGYKTAVLSFCIELDELTTKMMITFAGAIQSWFSGDSEPFEHSRALPWARICYPFQGVFILVNPHFCFQKDVYKK